VRKEKAWRTWSFCNSDCIWKSTNQNIFNVAGWAFGNFYPFGTQIEKRMACSWFISIYFRITPCSWHSSEAIIKFSHGFFVFQIRWAILGKKIFKADPEGPDAPAVWAFSGQPAILPQMPPGHSYTGIPSSRPSWGQSLWLSVCPVRDLHRFPHGKTDCRCPYLSWIRYGFSPCPFSKLLSWNVSEKLSKCPKWRIINATWNALWMVGFNKKYYSEKNDWQFKSTI